MISKSIVKEESATYELLPLAMLSLYRILANSWSTIPIVAESAGTKQPA